MSTQTKVSTVQVYWGDSDDETLPTVPTKQTKQEQEKKIKEIKQKQKNNRFSVFTEEESEPESDNEN